MSIHHYRERFWGPGEDGLGPGEDGWGLQRGAGGLGSEHGARALRPSGGREGVWSFWGDGTDIRTFIWADGWKFSCSIGHRPRCPESESSLKVNHEVKNSFL